MCFAEENELMKQKIKDFEKANGRLMQIFKKKTSEFRDTVNQLFGYRVDYYEERYPPSPLSLSLPLSPHTLTHTPHLFS